MRAETETQAAPTQAAPTLEHTRGERIRALAREIAAYHEGELLRREACARLPRLQREFTEAQELFVSLDGAHHAATVAEADAARALVAVPGNAIPSAEAEAALLEARHARQALDERLEDAAEHARIISRVVTEVLPLAKRSNANPLRALEARARGLAAEAAAFYEASRTNVEEKAGNLAGAERRARECAAIRDACARRAQVSRAIPDMQDVNRAQGAVDMALGAVDQARRELSAAEMLARLAEGDLEAARRVLGVQ